MRTNDWGQQVEMDSQGRLLLPQLLRDSAQLKGEVAVMGYLNRLEVQSMEGVRKEVEEAFTPEDEKNLDDLGI
jgi:MraZ protein